MQDNYVHLHVHTEFSLLDGVTPVKALVGKAAQMGMKAIAMTDHGNMFGVLKLFETAKDAGIKPILGCEMYVAPRGMTDREFHLDKKAFHILLLAKNEIGYRNLTKIVSLGHTKGFYFRPRADRALLAELSEGIIACSACLGGQVASMLLNNRYEDAKDAARWYQKTFGDGNYYLEIMEHGLNGQSEVNKALKEISSELSIPIIATNDVHYLTKDDAMVQDVMMCIQKGKTLTDAEQSADSTGDITGSEGSEKSTDKFSFDSQEFYLKSGAEMAELFKDFPGAVEATSELADKIDFELERGKIYLPSFEVPDNKTDGDYLHELTIKGLEKRYPVVTSDIRDRAEFELKVINDMGFPAYFLIVWDLIKYARDNDIPVGPGRGSVAGSIVAFALEITDVDPLKYDLLFERFLNPARISMPDIDMDFCYERRDEMIDYARRKYGDDKVAMIVTFGRLKARFAIRDVGRVMGIPLEIVDRIAKMVPIIIPDKKVTIENAIDYNPDLRAEYENDPQIKKLLNVSKRIEGLARNTSTHAAGVVISKRPLVEHLPVYKTPSDSMPMTQVTGDELERMGLLKMDFLGLRTLTVMHDSVRHIQRTHGKKIVLSELPLDDEKTYQLFCTAETDGIFQFEGNTVKGLLTRIRPNCIEDLIALNALNRPGPLGSGMADNFIENRKKPTAEVDCYHELIQPVLIETFGTMLYQEQIMRIANIIAGFTLAQSDLLRRAMGKKKKEEMEKLEVEFVEKCTEKTGDEKLAKKLFSLIVQFSGYGFNKSHSAAYALLAYQTGYLKANYPAEFMSALLSSIMGDTTKVAKYIDDCKRMNVVVMPPDVNSGDLKFVPGKAGIIFGLGAVKNVGENAVHAIVAERLENGEYKTLFDLCRRIDPRVVNSKTLESLIRCGACDSMEGNRAQKILALDEALEFGRAAQRDRISGQGSLFGEEEDLGAEPALKNREEFDIKQVLSDEKELLGMYLSHHPLDPYSKWIRQKSNITAAELYDPELGEKKSVKIAGIINSKKDFTTRRGEIMSSIEVEDFTGKISVTVFPEQRQLFASELKEENIVAIRGQINIRVLESMDGEEKTEIKVICRKLESYFTSPEEDENKPVTFEKKPVILKKVHVRFMQMPDFNKNKNMLRELKNIISSSPGDTDVIVHLEENEDNNGRKFLLKNYEVRYSPEFIRLARKFFGEDNVWVESQKIQ